MASKILYPPTLDSYSPAFIVGETSKCRIYFSLSKFNSSSDFNSIQVSVFKQESGLNVIKKIDNKSLNHYRVTGIILNVKAYKVKDNLFYIDIENDDIANGWTIGWIYKIQIRLSSVEYDNSIGQAAWINANANNFSEWSTVCITKAIGENHITIPSLNFDNKVNSLNTNFIISSSTLEIIGDYSNDDSSEVLYSYQMKLYDNSNFLLEDSGILYTNKYVNSNQFNYLFKTELINENNYRIVFDYITNNKYSNSIAIELSTIYPLGKKIKAIVTTAETNNILNKVLDEDEGRLSIKLKGLIDDTYSGNICIRRASSKDDFRKWEDIKIITIRNKSFNDLDIIYDYTLESGIYYLYGVQSITELGERGILNVIDKPVQRIFEYGYLLGEKNRQLKLSFNHQMGNYRINVNDSKTDTIGSKFPFITRNGNIYYRTIPINALISFWEDENHTFLKEDFLFNYEKAPIEQYDYTYEREFRKSVLEFLHDGKPKLYKSPTEGNIIVRLTDIDCTPEQSLSRLIYNFSSTGNEIADATEENYRKYNLSDIGEIETNYQIYDTVLQIGQIYGKINVEEDIIKMIFDKYSTPKEIIDSEYIKNVIKIQNMKITIENDSLRIQDNQNNYKIGYNFIFNNKKITMYDHTFDFGEEISFSKEDNLILAGSADGSIKTIDVVIDFLYLIEKRVYTGKSLISRNYSKGIGQVIGSYKSGDSLYGEIYNKYLVEFNSQYRKLDSIMNVAIEAEPGSVFLLQDTIDKYREYTDILLREHIEDPDVDNNLIPESPHAEFILRDTTTKNQEYMEIGPTGLLVLDNMGAICNLKYVGRKTKDGKIDTTKNANILMDYYYYVEEGFYKEE